MTKDSDTFRAKLDEALEAFHGGQRGTDYGSETKPEPLQEPIEEPEPPQDYDEESTQPDSELPEEQRRLGESSGEKDDVPY